MSFLENTHLFKDGISFSTLALNYWLAYASVTTVGYGDRVPRSVLGRLCDTVWIGAGMIMTCSVTATVSSYILTEVNIDLRKKSIGVLNGSYEAEIASNDYPFSTIVRYNTYEDVKNAVITDTVSAGLLNADYVSWILKEADDNKMHIVKLLYYDLSVNGLTSTNKIISKLFQCYVEKRKHVEIATEYFRKECPVDAVHYDPGLMFGATWILPVIVVIAILFLISGFAYDLVKQIPTSKRVNEMMNENSPSDIKFLDQVNQISLNIKTTSGNLITLSNTHYN